MVGKWKEFEKELFRRGTLDQFQQEECARKLSREFSGMAFFPLSLSRLTPYVAVVGAHEGGRRRLLRIASRGASMAGFDGRSLAELRRGNLTLAVHDASPNLILSLAEHIPWLRPRPNPGRPSIGMGDRLGMATAAHIRAVEAGSLFPYLAQQSVRENISTGRGWCDVMADAVFGVFREGWTRGFSADADHLTDSDELAAAAKAGFVRYTLDLSSEVRDISGFDRMKLSRELVLMEKEQQGAEQWRKRYLGKAFRIASGFSMRNLVFDEKSFLRTVVRMGPAVARARQLAGTAMSLLRGRAIELELCLDEADMRTTPHEHLFVAMEMAEDDLPVAAIAPRFVGEFRKGGEYRGNTSRLARDMAFHAAVAKATSKHAVSVHSGGDKFSIYSRLGEACDGAFHIKTSGTSYVEALRAVARVDRSLFATVVATASKTFDEAKAEYRFDTDPQLLPAPEKLGAQELEEVYFSTREGRQLLHASSGAVLAGRRELGRKVRECLRENEQLHFELVGVHLKKHVELLGG